LPAGNSLGQARLPIPPQIESVMLRSILMLNYSAAKERLSVGAP